MIGNTSLAEEKVVEVRKQLFNDGPKATPGHDMISGTNGDIQNSTPTYMEKEAMLWSYYLEFNCNSNFLLRKS